MNADRIDADLDSVPPSVAPVGPGLAAPPQVDWPRSRLLERRQLLRSLITSATVRSIGPGTIDLDARIEAPRRWTGLVEPLVTGPTADRPVRVRIEVLAGPMLRVRVAPDEPGDGDTPMLAVPVAALEPIGVEPIVDGSTVRFELGAHAAEVSLHPFRLTVVDDAGRTVKGTNREGNDDAFLPVAFMQRLDELVLDQVGRAEVGDPQRDVEIDARVVKRVVADKPLEPADCARHLLLNPAGDIEGDFLDATQVARVAYAHRKVDGDLFLGQVQILDDTGVEPAIGDDNRYVGHGPYPSVAPADVGNPSLFAGVEFHEVSDSHGTVGQDEQAGKEIGEWTLQRERHGQRPNAERRHDRRDRNVQRLEQQEQADGNNQQPEYAAHDAAGDIDVGEAALEEDKQPIDEPVKEHQGRQQHQDLGDYRHDLVDLAWQRQQPFESPHAEDDSHDCQRDTQGLDHCRQQSAAGLLGANPEPTAQYPPEEQDGGDAYQEQHRGEQPRAYPQAQQLQVRTRGWGHDSGHPVRSVCVILIGWFS